MDEYAVPAVWKRVVAEQERADHSYGFATRHEDLAAGGRRPAFHQRIAAVHRDSERRHQAVADLYASNAVRRALETERPGRTGRFSVMADVAALAGARAAIIAAMDPRAFQTLVAASESRARRAQDMEFVLGEGPVRDVLTERRPVTAEGADVEERWPAYGPEIHALGYHGVVALPLFLRTVLAGAMVLFDPDEARVREPRLAAGQVGNALLRVLISEAPAVFGTETGPRTDVVQAADMIALYRGCTLDDAIASIRARALSEHQRVDSVVRAMLEECAAQTAQTAQTARPAQKAQTARNARTGRMAHGRPQSG